jgi:hypothetical protein
LFSQVVANNAELNAAHEAVAVGKAKVTEATQDCGSVFTVISGQVMTGGALRTMMFWLQVAVFDEASVTLHCTLYVPMEYEAASVGGNTTRLGSAVQASATVGVPNCDTTTTVEQAGVLETVTVNGSGQVIVGTTCSFTVTVKVQVDVLLCASTAV